MRISDWSSDVCSSDLRRREDARHLRHFPAQAGADRAGACQRHRLSLAVARPDRRVAPVPTPGRAVDGGRVAPSLAGGGNPWPADRLLLKRAVRLRSEEHTSELQSLMRISYAVFCLNKKKNDNEHTNTHDTDQYN